MSISLIGRRLLVSQKQSRNQEPLTVFPVERARVFCAASARLKRRCWEPKRASERDVVTKQQQNFKQVSAEMTERGKGLQKVREQNKDTLREKSEGCKKGSAWVYKLLWTREAHSNPGGAVDRLRFLQGGKPELWEHTHSCIWERCLG